MQGSGKDNPQRPCYGIRTHYGGRENVSRHRRIGYLNQIDYLNRSQTDCRNSNTQTKITEKPICCVPPNTNKPNTLLNIFKMPIKLNSPEQNAETRISRQKSPMNQYAVIFRISANQIRVLISIELNSLGQTAETQIS